MLFLINSLQNSPQLHATHPLILAVPQIGSTDTGVIFVTQASLGAVGLPSVDQALAEIFHRYAPHKQFTERPKMSFSPRSIPSTKERAKKNHTHPFFDFFFTVFSGEVESDEPLKIKNNPR